MFHGQFSLGVGIRNQAGFVRNRPTSFLHDNPNISTKLNAQENPSKTILLRGVHGYCGTKEAVRNKGGKMTPDF
jgi:hypothetical protein